MKPKNSREASGTRAGRSRASMILNTVVLCFIVAIACLWGSGCCSSARNPSVPRTGTGYVDFYTDSDLGLSWQVKRGGEDANEMRTVYSKFKPVEGNTLRLAARPGTHRFEVWFINRVTEGPQNVLVSVVEGKVTPVHVTLTAAGDTSVQSSSYEYRATVKATRRVTRTSGEQSVVFQIGTVAEPPQSYQPKEQMPYYRSAGSGKAAQ